MKAALVILGLLAATVACGGGSGGVPVFEQSNVHFEGCPTTPVQSDTTCRAAATLHNTGASGTSRQVFYFTLRLTSGDRRSTCTPDVPVVNAGAVAEVSCEISVPAGAVPADLVLSGR